MRRADQQLVVTPVDRASAREAFTARTAIELGAAAAAVGRVSPAELELLRRHAEQTCGLIRDGRFTDPDAYVEANRVFHEHLVGLAGSPALVEAYRRLSIPTLMALLLAHHPEANEALAVEHRDLADAYAMGDIERVRDAIVAHARHAEAVNDAALVAAGGRI